MKTELIANKVEMRGEGQETENETQSGQGMRAHDLIIALAWIATPIFVLCWMSRANLDGDALGTKISYCAAVIVLLFSLAMGSRGDSEHK